MEFKHLNLRLVKLPPRLELIVYLIAEELKATKVFNGLARIGLDDCFYQPYLGAAVLSYIGFEERDDDLVNFYQELLETYSEKIEADNAVIVERAIEVYVELQMERRRRLSKE